MFACECVFLNVWIQLNPEPERETIQCDDNLSSSSSSMLEIWHGYHLSNDAKAPTREILAQKIESKIHTHVGWRIEGMEADQIYNSGPSKSIAVGVQNEQMLEVTALNFKS